jgi:hypothetical protein
MGMLNFSIPSLSTEDEQMYNALQSYFPALKRLTIAVVIARGRGNMQECAKALVSLRDASIAYSISSATNPVSVSSQEIRRKQLEDDERYARSLLLLEQAELRDGDLNYPSDGESVEDDDDAEKEKKNGGFWSRTKSGFSAIGSKLSMRKKKDDGEKRKEKEKEKESKVEKKGEEQLKKAKEKSKSKEKDQKNPVTSKSRSTNRSKSIYAEPIVLPASQIQIQQIQQHPSAPMTGYVQQVPGYGAATAVTLAPQPGQVPQAGDRILPTYSAPTYGAPQPL